MKDATLKSTKELAEIFKVDRSTVNRLIRQNNLKPKSEVGCKLYDLKEALQAFTKNKEGKEVKRENNERIQLISKQEVANILGISTKTIERMIKDDKEFPRPCLIAQNTLRWILSEIENYILNRRVKIASEAA